MPSFGLQQVDSDRHWHSCQLPVMPAVRLILGRSYGAPDHDVTVRSPLFSEGLLRDLAFQHRLGEQFLQPGVLGLQLF